MTAVRLILLLVIVLPFAPARAMDGQSDIDPWEPMNRRIFAFNEALDKYLLRPVAKGYRFVIPDPVERGVTNFITNNNINI